jgi:hypothetical protein
MAKLIVGFRSLANTPKNGVEFLKRLALTFLLGTYIILLHIISPYRNFLSERCTSDKANAICKYVCIFCTLLLVLNHIIILCS